MKADCYKLYDDLLYEVQHGCNKNGNNDLVGYDLPRPSGRVAVKVVILHSGQEGDFDRKQPEENSGWHFKLLPKISPLFGIVCKQARNHPHGPWNHSGDNLKHIC